MDKKRQGLMMLISVMSLVLSACGSGQAIMPTVIPMSTNTSIPSTATMTLISPTATITSTSPIATLTTIPSVTFSPNTPTVQDATITTCDQYGNVEINGNIYNVQNNIWNPSSGGTQCLSVDKLTGVFMITTQTNKQTTNGAPASYPFIYMGCHWGNCTNSNPMPIQVSAIKSATSSWSITTAAGAWNASYDIWFNTTPTTTGAPDGTELMIWLNSQGGVQPAGSVVAKGVNISGDSYNVWFSPDSNAKYVAYQKTNVTTSLSPDIKAFINNSVSRGYLDPSWYLIAVEAGFEIWNGGVEMQTNSFSVSVSGSD